MTRFSVYYEKRPRLAIDERRAVAFSRPRADPAKTPSFRPDKFGVETRRVTSGPLFAIVAAVKDVSVEEAKTLLEAGIPYLDVRTPLEFAAGHAPKALNVPLHLNAPDGMIPNPDFAKLALLVLRGKSSVLVGCRSGARSRIACELLEPELPFEPYHLTLGFEGKRDAFGRLTPGWHSTGLVETDARPEQTYEVLRLLLAADSPNPRD